MAEESGVEICWCVGMRTGDVHFATSRRVCQGQLQTPIRLPIRQALAQFRKAPMEKNLPVAGRGVGPMK